jgi:predicted lipoprotein
MTIASATRHPWLLLSAACMLGIGIARPWTIRPIAPSVEAAAGASSLSSAFDPFRYVLSIWDSRVVPAASSSSTDLSRALGEAKTGSGPARAMLVSGTGVVISVDTRSRVGLAQIDLAPGDGQADAALQIGPVLRGTVLRDAVGFIRFEDFANQIDYARVASALNSRVLETVLRDIGTADALRGRTIEFRGAALVGSATTEVIPVTLQVRPATTKGAVP